MSIARACACSDSISLSSRSFDATIFASRKPAASSMLARLDRQVGEVAGVEPDAGELVALRAQLACRPRSRARRRRACRRCRRAACSCRASPRRRRETPRARRRRTSPSCARACPRTGMPNSLPASTFDVAAQPPMYAARDAASPPSMPCARRSPNSRTGVAAARPGTTRAAFVAIERLEVDEVSSARLDELRLRDRPATRTIGSCGNTSVPSGTASTSREPEVARGSRGSRGRTAAGRRCAQPREVREVVGVEAELLEDAIERGVARRRSRTRRRTAPAEGEVKTASRRPARRFQ